MMYALGYLSYTLLMLSQDGNATDATLVSMQPLVFPREGHALEPQIPCR
jgi:hypothetical protein